MDARVVLVAAVVGALGYAMARALAVATQNGTDEEDRAFCESEHVPAA